MSVIIATVNGVVASSIDITDRGFTYGDGIFETMLVANHHIPLISYHLKRLFKGLSVLSIDIDRSKINGYLSLIEPYFFKQQSPLVCKLIVTRGEGGKGYQAGVSQAQVVIVLSSYIPANYSDGIQVHSCHTTLGHQASLAGIKALSALTYVLAANERIDTIYDEGLLFDVKGHLIEATARNVFLVDAKDRLLTPKLDCCGVEGVMRSWLIDYVKHNNIIEVIEQPINRQDIASAKEMFLTNSVTGISPVLSWFDNSAVSSPTRCWLSGPVTQLLMAQSNQLLIESTL